MIIIILIILFILWTMLKCASIYDEIEERKIEKYRNQHFFEKK